MARDQERTVPSIGERIDGVTSVNVHSGSQGRNNVPRQPSSARGCVIIPRWEARDVASCLLEAVDLPDHPIALREYLELAVVVLGEAHVHAAAARDGGRAGQRIAAAPACAEHLFRKPAETGVHLMERLDRSRYADRRSLRTSA